MIFLPDVTLVTVTSVDIPQSVNALRVSSEKIQFASVKILTSEDISSLPEKVTHVTIPKLDFYGYSKFIIEELYKYVETQYCLIIQADGFVINSHLWNDEFLKYDYIGAPWPETIGTSFGNLDLTGNRVGNGGFSLRSKIFLEACSKVNFDSIEEQIKSEDFLLCHYLHERMLNEGVRFAPLKLAQSFSLESCLDPSNHTLDNVFGFHGKNWLQSEKIQSKLASEPGI